MSKVYGFGAAGIDFRIQTADYGDTYKDKLLAQKTMVFGGGPVANFLTQVARLGGTAAWLGKLGADPLARQIVQTLEQERIDCAHVIYSAEHCSPFNLAVYSGPEMRRRCGFCLPNSLAELTDGDTAAFCRQIQPDDYVMVEIGEIPLAATIQFMRRARDMGATIVIDVDLDPVKQCGGTREQFEEICSLSDVIVPNIVAMSTLYPGLSDEALAERLYKEYRKAIVVSSGSRGAFFRTAEQALQHSPPLQVEVVDTVGAGDAFHGGLVYALSSGHSITQAVALGNVCGGLNCTAFGARSGMPDLATAKKHVVGW